MLGWALFLSCLVYLSFSKELTTEGTCNSHDGVIKLTTTILKDAKVDDAQIFYIDNTNIVFLKTRGSKGALYRSADSGKTWDLQTVAGVLPQYNGESIIRISTTRASSSTLYILGEGSKLWVTVDGGLTYKVFTNLPTGTTYLSPNNLESNYVLASSNSAWFISTNYGEHWEKMLDVAKNDGSVVAWTIFTDHSHKRIYAKILPAQREVGAKSSYDSIIVYSDDFFKTSVTLPVKNIHRWFMTGPDKIVLVTCLDVSACSSKSMYISEDAGANFFPATFPDFEHETRNETSIRPLEISDDVIWTVVERYCKGTYCYGDLFHSYSADKEFTHSLSEAKLLQGTLDFTKYNSLDGIYVVNQYFDVETEDDERVRTLITFNKGSTWNVLKAPEKDAKGQPTNCEIKDGCSLHLHGWIDSNNGFDGFYSPPNAIGVMVGSGNMGDRLLDRIDEVNFYYSRNGGIDWEEVRSGRWVPEVGNHGTVVVAANIGESSNTIVYSLDDGDSWLDCQIHEKLIDIRNIRVSQGWDKTDFVVYGHKEGNAYLIHVDFSGAYKGKCEQGDFEDWSPTDEHGDCFMGHKITYARRRFGTACFLDEEHIHETTATNCPCSVYDYECAECYFRPTLSAPCHFACMKDGHLPPSPPNAAFCDKSTSASPLYYTVPEPIGYVVVSEDTCDPSLRGSALPPPALVSCEEWKALTSVPEIPNAPEESHSNTTGYVIMAIVFIALVVAGVVYLYRTDERFKAKVSATFGWKSDERDVSYQQISSNVISSDEELSTEAPQIAADQLESSSETSS